MLLKGQNLFTDLLREPHFIFLTSLLKQEILKINTLEIIFVGCLIPGTAEISISSLLCSKVHYQMKFALLMFILHCVSISTNINKRSVFGKELGMFYSGVLRCTSGSLVQALTFFQGIKFFDSLSV